MAIFAKKLDTRGIDQPMSQPQPSQSEAAAPRTPPPPGKPKTYGIADAIQLMRTLPFDDNVDLVVQVIRATLASLNVRVQDIIEDANRKEKNIHEGIATLHSKVAELERELESRVKEINALETDLKETISVKERLQLSETIAVVPAIPVDMADAVSAASGAAAASVPPAPPPSNGRF